MPRERTEGIRFISSPNSSFNGERSGLAAVCNAAWRSPGVGLARRAPLGDQVDPGATSPSANYSGQRRHRYQHPRSGRRAVSVTAWNPWRSTAARCGAQAATSVRGQNQLGYAISLANSADQPTPSAQAQIRDAVTWRPEAANLSKGPGHRGRLRSLPRPGAHNSAPRGPSLSLPEGQPQPHHPVP